MLRRLYPREVHRGPGCPARLRRAPSAPPGAAPSAIRSISAWACCLLLAVGAGLNDARPRSSSAGWVGGPRSALPALAATAVWLTVAWLAVLAVLRRRWALVTAVIGRRRPARTAAGRPARTQPAACRDPGPGELHDGSAVFGVLTGAFILVLTAGAAVLMADMESPQAGRPGARQRWHRALRRLREGGRHAPGRRRDRRRRRRGLARPGPGPGHRDRGRRRTPHARHRGLGCGSGGARPPEAPASAVAACPFCPAPTQRSRNLAQDAVLQAVLRGRPGRATWRYINDLKAYFCRVLINEVYHLCGQLAAARALRSCHPGGDERRLDARPTLGGGDGGHPSDSPDLALEVPRPARSHVGLRAGPLDPARLLPRPDRGDRGTRAVCCLTGHQPG